MINAFGEGVPDRVKALIKLSHEKFDGTGYPHQKRGFDQDRHAQLLAIAEMLDSVSKGQWDGKKRSYNDALDVLTSFEKDSDLPNYFSSEVLLSIKRWGLTEGRTKPSR
jgi:HD-GYP domain-containing protein (c-di-GMP phosphodiesterase class II)